MPRSSKYILVCMPVRKAQHIEKLYHQVVVPAFEPMIRVKRVENIPGDWVAVLRQHLQKASLVLFDMTRIEGSFNPNVMRELIYVNTCLLDWTAGYNLPPLVMYMHRDENFQDMRGLAWYHAAKIDENLVGSEESTKNNLALSRSIMVFNYTYLEAIKSFKERLWDLKELISQSELPPLYNSIIDPYDLKHPTLEVTLRNVGFPPFYLRDEQYDGFVLASMAPKDILHSSDKFWRNAYHVFKFSSIFRTQVFRWLNEPPDVVDRYVKYGLLKMILVMIGSGYIDYQVEKEIGKYLESKTDKDCWLLAKEIMMSLKPKAEQDDEIAQVLMEAMHKGLTTEDQVVRLWKKKDVKKR